jgi:hypothetical protein
VQAWVEHLPADASSDLDWVKVGASVTLQVRLTLAQLRNDRYDEIEWAGAIGLPARVEGEQLRIRIAEYELHRGDPLGSEVFLTVANREHRLVYSDGIDVP